MSRTGLLALAVVAALAVAPGRALAFPTGDQFDMDALDEDGAGGVAFTGAPRWAGHDCAVCHTGAPGRVGVELQAEPYALFSDGYTPGATYRMRVVLRHDWAGSAFRDAGDGCGFAVEPYTPCDANGFALEIDDDAGRPVGRLGAAPGNNGCNGTAGDASPAVVDRPAAAKNAERAYTEVASPGGSAGAQDADVRVLDDGTAVTHRGLHHGVTEWDFCWTAPAAGAGPLIAHVAVVDGNGGDGTPSFPADATGDDVFAGAVPLLEQGASPPHDQTGGCAVGGGTPTSLAPVALALLALVARRRRRVAAVALVAVLATGCVHVKAHEREYLAKRKMVFAPDPGEDELDLHMQEAREGSSGCYGSAGGGCGCN